MKLSRSINDSFKSLKCKLSSMDTRRSSCQMEEDYAFMACTIRVNMARKGSYKALQALSSTQGLRSFDMGEDGIIQMSGYVKPYSFMYALGKAGRHVELLWFQHGKCSSYLFGPDRKLFIGRAARHPQLQSYPRHNGEGISCCSFM